MKVSVVVPVFNEIGTIQKSMFEIYTRCGDKELIVVDDGSNDGTYGWLQGYSQSCRHPFKLIRNKRNRGKGFSVRRGLQRVTSDIVLIQDADLEYDPHEWLRLTWPIFSGKADVVYGSRFRGSSPKRVMYFSHYLANKFLTFLSNCFTGLNLSDVETGAKCFRASILKDVDLKENRFGFEPEITAKVKKHRIYEVGISYHGRTYEEGKKIRFRDGLWAVWCIVRYNLW